MINLLSNHKDIFEDGIGDTLFALCRLANQLGIDMTKSFNLVSKRILDKYNSKGKETKIIKKS